MAINTDQINPNAFGYTPTFPEGDGLTSFISGYLGARKAGVEESKPPVDATGRPTGEPPPKPSFFNRFTKGVMNAPGVRAEGADPFARLKELGFQQQLASKAVELQGHELTNKLKLQQLTDTLEDQRTFDAFQEQVKADPNFLSTGELPAFKTPQYRMAASAQQLAHSRGLLMEKNKQVILNHQKGLAALAGDDPEAYSQISAMEDVKGLPSPDAISALSTALARVKVQKENAAKLAEIEALQRGDVPTTTVTEKGVSTTFRPAPKTSTDTAPKTVDIGDGTKLAWVPGGKTLHVIKGGKTEEFTPFQMSNIAKTLPDKDPRKKQIIDFLADTAVAQATPKTNAPAAPKPPQAGEVRQGYRFKGGDPADKNSWEQVQ